MQDLVAERAGDDLRLHFTVPSHTTDGVALRSFPLTATLCRSEGSAPACVPVGAEELQGQQQLFRPGAEVTWVDRLPASLRAGPPRPISVRLTLRSAAGRSAGSSPPAWAMAGAAPPAVVDLRITGTRRGPLLRWTAQAGAGEVLLQRTKVESADKGPARRGGRQSSPEITWLEAAPGATGAGETIDGTAAAGAEYRYRAVRRVRVVAEGHTLEARSAPSEEVTMRWEAVYPPPAPAQLTAAAFPSPAGAGAAAAFDVDLVWEPLEDPDVVGYVVTRTPLASNGDAAGSPAQLTPKPDPTPAFHDAGALPGNAYRYEVRAVDAHGNLGPPAITTVAAQPR